MRPSPTPFVLLVITAALLLTGCQAGSDDTRIPALAQTLGGDVAAAGRDLSGEWKIVIDPFETGTVDYKSRPRKNGFWRDARAGGPMELVEYSFDDGPALNVPGDWDTQRDDLFLYEGTVWYRRQFEYRPDTDQRHFIRVGAANRRSSVWLNSKHLGDSAVGFTPSTYECTEVIRDGVNTLIIRVDNRRDPAGVPGMRTDWWNYGGLTRPVTVFSKPETFIRDAHAELAEDTQTIRGWIALDGPDAADRLVRVAVGGEQIDATTGSDGIARYELERADLALWSPDSPALHDFRVSLDGAAGIEDSFSDRVGLRTVSTSGDRILVNGEPVLLRGICVHEEQITGDGRSWSREHALELAAEIKRLGCNFVRLAHYPHAEPVARVMDEAGILVWAEVPVYWTLDYTNPATLDEAKAHLRGLIGRDHNRASIAFWSIGNETGVGPDVTRFRRALADEVRRLDDTRLLAAALEATLTVENGRVTRMVIDDPFGEFVDVLAINTYIGWYVGRTEDLAGLPVERSFDKPFMVSEFGAGAKRGLPSPFPGEPAAKWTELYQAQLYAATLEWLERSPGFAGVAPWILTDFRSPRRQLPGVQDWWNRKGLLDEQGRPKQAHKLVREIYARWADSGIAAPGADSSEPPGNSQP